MSKWVLIEVENQNINKPDTYNSYKETYKEMKNRYGTLVNDGEEASIGAYNACIQTDSYNIDWKIYEVETQTCKWIKYDYRTLCPKEHDANNPYWRIPENMDKLKYCPYCGKEIIIED